jgi:hypothetical protein
MSHPTAKGPLAHRARAVRVTTAFPQAEARIVAFQDPATLWPPRVGDYVRVKKTGILGEVVGTTGAGKDRQYAVVLLARTPDHTRASYGLEDLESVWPRSLAEVDPPALTPPRRGRRTRPNRLREG